MSRDDSRPYRRLRATDLLSVATGGGAGTALRWALVELAGADNETAAIVMVNLVGSFLIGVLAGHRVRRGLWRAGAIGFCGGLTTFATHSVDVARRLQGGDHLAGVILAVAVAVAAVLVAWFGTRLGRLLRTGRLR